MQKLKQGHVGTSKYHIQS